MKTVRIIVGVLLCFWIAYTFLGIRAVRDFQALDSSFLPILNEHKVMASLTVCILVVIALWLILVIGHTYIGELVSLVVTILTMIALCVSLSWDMSYETYTLLVPFSLLGVYKVFQATVLFLKICTLLFFMGHLFTLLRVGIHEEIDYKQ